MSIATLLSRGSVLPQGDVQSMLAASVEAGGRIDFALDELAAWSESIGYFRHLSAANEYLQFADDRTGTPLRLQINYSRLAYKLPEGPKAVACPLCIENVGTPGKELLRVFELELAGTPFFAHLTPFPLHPGHFVLNGRAHEPMRIGERGLRETAEFLRRAPGWLAASNSDVAWAGASVLGHHHVQVFRRLSLPVEIAPVVRRGVLGGCIAAFLDWHCPVARIAGPAESVLALGSDLVSRWKSTAPGEATCNYLMREGGDGLLLHLFFRHPDYRTPESLRGIKAEGVGIIEVAGEIIVPPLPDRDRAANRAWFEANGLDVCRGIIGGNGPWSDQLTREWYEQFVFGS